MQRLDWNRLLLKDRLFAAKHKASDDFDVRTEYQRDIDRILFSTAFRRLQDKTQVLPFPGSDFVHTRLTHSLEVSSIGRSLGKLVGNFVINKGEINDATIAPDDFGNIVVAACLAHDIGNPPFGHTGEKAIGKAYKKEKISSKLNPLEAGDLINFEGNAAGFRILTNDHASAIPGGLKLTYATLGAYSKYPCASIKPKLNTLGNHGKRKSLSKFGYFQQEKDIFKKVANELGLIHLSLDSENGAWCRHPLAFIVEAADTFTYRIVDLEDAHKMNFICTKKTEDLLFEIVKRSADPRCDLNDWKSIKDPNERIGALRSKALNSLIHEAFIVFKDNYEDIMTAKFDKEIPDIVPSQPYLETIENETKQHFFRHSLVIDVELAGFEVLGGLIGQFVDALKNPNDIQSKRLLLKLSDQFKDEIALPTTSYYKKLLLISDFVSRMTDSYALDLFRKLKGIELSNY
ncbi:MAG: dGTP triphosphohydrolase [Flavipsychrobacter sp.]